MPKEQRSFKAMDYYRSPPLTSNNLVYPPINSRPMATPYYEPLQHSYQNMSSYATGGPVQQPPLPLPTQHYVQSTPMPPSIRPSSGAWTPIDDRTLIAARKQGLNWQPIQATYFPNKSANACRKRHERLMERKSSDDWDNVKSETLAKHYMDMRKEIWSGLAAATGEKWTVVEQKKCMSTGLKNMQTSARAYARRERMMEAGGQTGNAPYSDHNDYEVHEDSGISINLDGDYDRDNGSEASTNDPLNQQHYSYAPQVLSDGRPDGYPQTDRNDGYPQSDRNDGYPQTDRSPYHQDNRASFHSRLPSMDMGIDAIINQPSGL
ncbi:putative myb family transcription factor protein [Botrytis fragariae]|uniref:Putative myb family transcription factor protein n=1 Tax=Botrytis fragariae TaxID=1964551 RepID=A0A8H6EMU3_9HELO|nr:putative myb family transcription factor protein [Botrytis fragariae]KAF5878072.1 putative myb family transcription factor protein [Botrytis fragariae]